MPGERRRRKRSLKRKINVVVLVKLLNCDKQIVLCCIMEHVVSWNMLYHGTCCIMEHVVSWNMLYHGTCCIMEHVVSEHVVSWNMLYHGTCCIMEHVVSWNRDSYLICQH